MNQTFDYFGEPEIPYIILTNPNGEELFSLGLAYNTKLINRFNALSDFNFKFPKSINGGQTNLEAYDFIQNKRLVLVEGHGYYQIVNVQEDNDGSVPLLNVECKSLENELIQKSVAVYAGTKPLYNISNPNGTILGDMVELAPTWSVGTIDTELLVKFRTFNISSSNIYQFLMNDVSIAFSCVFFFDTLTKTISAKTIENATLTTDIFLSFDNLLNNTKFSQKSDEITTCMAVFGGGDLNIRTVNPLGTNKIYDFSYYANQDWMSNDLQFAIEDWLALIASRQPDYSANLLLLQTYNSQLLALQSTLATLNEELLALQGVQRARINANLPYADINTQITAKQAQIVSQNTLITNKRTQITTVTAVIHATNLNVSMEENFNEEQFLELSSFIYENTYKNENIIETDSMTLPEVQDAAMDLYEQGQEVLARVSQPRYEIEVEAANYIALSEFGVFTDQTELGCVVTVELKNEVFVEAVLLEIEMTFDDPSDFSFTFSNRIRLDGAGFTYSDLMGQTIRTSNAVTFDSLAWSDWDNNYRDDVSTFITSALDTTVNNLISSPAQEILINQNGLRGKAVSGSGYSPQEVWLTSNMLAFSDDGFQTAKLALGRITLPAGGTAYGLVGDVIIGRILAGNTLTIANSANNFVLDQTGATLNNAKFTIQTTNVKIFLDPTATRSFRIQKNEGGTFNDKFWVDNAGNVNFAGILSGATGTFTGTITAAAGNIGTLVIDSLGLKTANGVNYLRGNGDLKWGGLTISGSTASFSGTIFADKLVGQVVNDQIASGLNAGKVTTGTMSGSRIFGGVASAPGGAVVDLSESGQVTISGAYLQFLNTNVSIQMDGNTIGLFGDTYVSDSLEIGGSLIVSGGSGTNGTFSVSTPFGTRFFVFSRGVLVSVHS